MTFATEIVKNVNTPVILFQSFKKNVELNFFTTYSSHIWYVNLNAIYVDIESTLLDGVSAENIKSLDQVYSDDVLLSKVSSIANITQGSYFYDGPNRNLYIQLNNNSRPDLHNITYDVVFLALKKGGQTNYYDGCYYEERIESIPSISREKEDLFNSKFDYGGCNIRITNTDGEYDTLIEDENILQSGIKLFFGFDGLEFSEFRRLYSGFIENITLNSDRIELSIRDEKKKLNNPVTQNIFDLTTYPYLTDDNIGKVIPVAYGNLRNIPIVCTNEEESGPANYQFKICDTTFHSIKDVSTVLVNGTAVTFSNENLTNATFTLSTLDYSPGDDVTAYVEGYVDDSGDLIKNALDIIQDLLVNIYGVTFDNTYFNLARWEQSRAYDINLFIDENTKLSKAIELITVSSLVTFIVEDDGRFSARIFDSGASVLDYLTNEDIFDYYDIDYDLEEMITSVITKYNKNYFDDEYSSYLDESLESNLIDLYDYNERKEFETTIINLADAQDYASKVLEQRGLLYKIFSITTKMESIYREIGDIVRVNIARPQAPDMGDYDCEVIGIRKMIDNFSIRLTLRPFKKYVNLDLGQSAYWFDFSDSSEDGSYYNDDPESEADIYGTDIVAI